MKIKKKQEKSEKKKLKKIFIQKIIENNIKVDKNAKKEKKKYRY